MTVTNYNDGKWHGWNGGTMPVHRLSWVNVMLSCGTLEKRDKEASVYDWDHTSVNIVAFRVTKEYKEPQEYWLCWDALGCSYILNGPIVGSDTWTKIIHVREVETND